jgi:hypothetical protein
MRIGSISWHEPVAEIGQQHGFEIELGRRRCCFAARQARRRSCQLAQTPHGGRIIECPRLVAFDAHQRAALRCEARTQRLFGRLAQRIGRHQGCKPLEPAPARKLDRARHGRLRCDPERVNAFGRNAAVVRKAQHGHARCAHRGGDRLRFSAQQRTHHKLGLLLERPFGGKLGALRRAGRVAHEQHKIVVGDVEHGLGCGIEQRLAHARIGSRQRQQQRHTRRIAPACARCCTGTRHGIDAQGRFGRFGCDRCWSGFGRRRRVCGRGGRGRCWGGRHNAHARLALTEKARYAVAHAFGRLAGRQHRDKQGQNGNQNATHGGNLSCNRPSSNRGRH